MGKKPNKKKKIRRSVVFSFVVLGAIFGIYLSGYLNDWSANVLFADCWCCADDSSGWHYFSSWHTAVLFHYYVEIAVCTAIAGLFGWRVG